MLELIELGEYNKLIAYVAIRAVIILICWLFMVFGNVVDFWSGITTAKALGEPIKSKGFRRTIAKIGDYVKLMIFAFMFDILGSLLAFYKIPFATIFCTIAILLIESKSVIENSRRKKTHAADVPEVVKQIVQAATTEQGHKVLETIKEILEKDNKQ